jgi:puromycin-sensitive aminopeptidase
MSKNVRRLFAGFHPENYNVLLDIDPEKMVFSGKVTITGKKTGRPSQRLTFHQKNLKITSATAVKHNKKGDEEITITRINTQKSFDEVRLHAEKMLYPGNYTVTMEFSGKITRNMEGIYPSYFTQNGKDKKIISTQFESHHAREAFPCIDEPEAKASFQLALATPKNDTVISNTPDEREAEVDSLQFIVDSKKQELKTINYKLSTFQTTPKMSTYLLAFATGDMKFLEKKTKDGVLVRTYASPDNAAHTQFALDVAVKCLEFYNEYFATPYPLPKCDLLALPDFASGAMENWGCITFREQCLLVDPKNTSVGVKQYVAMVVAHELAHQWFGNLVTMRWWTDLWLNEGFASWIEYLATDHNFPEWQMWQQFAADEQQAAMKMDALENTHPIEVPISHPDEIRTIFDAISYEKGASAINMLATYLGHDTFRDGLRLYLKNHAYSNTDTVDLWQALQEVSGKPVKDFMHAWTSQPGFPIVRANITQHMPVVDASIAATKHYSDEGSMDFNQARFFVNPSADTDGQSQTWPIPLLASEKLPEDLVSQGAKEISLPKSYQPLLLNQGRNGFYRVVYNPDHQSLLTDQIAAGKLSPIDRMGLLSDNFETAKAGYQPTIEALKLLQAYENEDNPVVWGIMAANIASVRTAMDNEELRERMKPFVRNLAATQFQRLGWEEQPNEPYFDTILRPTILGLSSFGEEPNVTDEARKRFDAMQKPEDLHPDLRAVVYTTIARQGTKKDFDKLLKMHNDSTNSEERVTLSAALTAFEQPELIDKALAQVNGKNVRLQDATYWLAYALGNRFAKDKAWQWIQTHWDWLQKNLGSDLSFFRLPNYVARVQSHKEFLPEFEQFFRSHMSPAFERPVNQAIETITWQSAWRTRDHAQILKFFS